MREYSQVQENLGSDMFARGRKTEPDKEEPPSSLEDAAIASAPSAVSGV